MSVLLAFDVDGTLDTSSGPVAWTKVRALAAEDAHLVLGIVSPSAARPQDDTPAYAAADGSRAGALRLFRAAYPRARLRFYISNNNDPQEAAAAGFAFVTEAEFARGMEGP